MRARLKPMLFDDEFIDAAHHNRLRRGKETRNR